MLINITEKCIKKKKLLFFRQTEYYKQYKLPTWKTIKNVANIVNKNNQTVIIFQICIYISNSIYINFGLIGLRN